MPAEPVQEDGLEGEEATYTALNSPLMVLGIGGLEEDKQIPLG